MLFTLINVIAYDLSPLAAFIPVNGESQSPLRYFDFTILMEEKVISPYIKVNQLEKFAISNLTRWN